ncbi:AAA family ATPase [Yinghuangia sp. ASG 101]|uniref:LuxR family transcriptional regulator n=1 Tax=Yinghuangia sp. ASG 101 TaxID=2896848 RepID=UPI001E520256|nr:LuxR family transcriptional regulator [Yinghuangia sp. ASG 101]UGQ12422.1 AAA family ATPase [Yinghuangia sp. ASG 101]
MAETTTTPGARPDCIRTAEAHRLGTALDAAHAGASRFVDLVGEPGTGKTRLLAALADDVRARGMRVLRSRCSERERNLPLHLFGSAEPALPLLPEPRHGDDAHDQQRRLHTHGLLRALLTERVGDGALVFVDDFHWADPASLDLIDHLVRAPLNAPALFVLARRPRQSSPRVRAILAHGAESGVVERIDLNPLPAAQAARLLGLDPHDARLRDVHERGAGNPLYMAIAAAEADAADDPAGPLIRDDRPIPEPYDALLSREIALLSPSEVRIVESAAVLGERFDREALTEVSGLSHEEECAATAGLVRRDLFRPVGLTSSLRFRHESLRRLVYSQTDPCRRFTQHRRALAVLAARGASAAERALHIARAPSKQAVAEDREVLSTAAREALPGSPPTAAHWLRAALRLPGGTEDTGRTDLVTRLIEVLGATERLAEHGDFLREALSRVPAGETPARFTAVALRARLECQLDGYGTAVQVLDQEFAGYGDRLPHGAAPLLLLRETLSLLNEQIPAPAQIHRALRAARADRDEVSEVGALILRTVYEVLGGAGPIPHEPSPGGAAGTVGSARQVRACASTLDGLDDSRLAEHPEHLAMLGWAEIALGRLTEARRHFARGARLAEGTAHCYLLPLLLTGLCTAQLFLGQLSTARRSAADANEAARVYNGGHMGPLALALRQWIAAVSGGGDPDADKPALLPGMAGLGVIGAYVLADAARHRGELPRAAALVMATGLGPDLAQIPVYLRPACYEVLTAAAVEADDPAAQEWARRGAGVADALGTEPQRAYALMARAHVVAGERPGVAADLYREAARLFAASGLLWAQAWALVEAAAPAATDGRLDEAFTALDLAEELAERAGAGRVLERARDVRAHLNGGAPRPATGDADLSPLTAREREVALLAGRGSKTREIAEQLHLSPRTVDVHLTRIYRKLDIPSRAALARLLAGM